VIDHKFKGVAAEKIAGETGFPDRVLKGGMAEYGTGSRTDESEADTSPNDFHLWGDLEVVLRELEVLCPEDRNYPTHASEVTNVVVGNLISANRRFDHKLVKNPTVSVGFRVTIR
jgi:hypothetical protein